MNHAEEDEKLIEAYQNGDQKAFEQLWRKYHEYVFKTIRFKGVPMPDAEDYAQELWIKLIDPLKAFRFDCPFEGYLDRAINNQVIDYYRTRGKNRFISLFALIFGESEDETTLVDVMVNPNAEPPDHEAHYRELLRVVGSCIKLITNRTMKILVCLWLKNIKRRQMQELLKIPPGTVNGMLERGKEKFRACVKKKYLMQNE